jgi:glycosyltransferase involved in cell wall biosynthesis
METQGLVAPEAMAMEKPVIFSNTGPGPETIDHGVNGWLCNPKDPVDIASVILEALNHKDSFKNIGMEARKKVFGKFEPILIADRNLDFYRKIKNS